MIKIIRSRRSIRKYANRMIEEEKLLLLEETLLRAPSGRNSQPCEFIFVTDRPTLEKFAIARPTSGEFLANAPLAVVVCGDAAKSDLWIEDCSIAASYIQLLAVDLGLGSCWVQIRGRKHDDFISAEEYLQELLGIPNRIKIECIIGIGYGAEEKPPHTEEELSYNKIHKNKY